MQEFRFDQTLSLIFTISVRTLPRSLLFAVLFIAVYLGVHYLGTTVLESMSSILRPEGQRNTVLFVFLVVLYVVFISFFFSTFYAAITHEMLQSLENTRTSFGETLGQGCSLVLPVLGVWLLTSLSIMLGLLCLLLPGVLLMIVLSVALPAAVSERPGAIASLRRSRDLTVGYHGQIFGLLLCTLVIGLVIDQAANLVEELGHASGFMAGTIITYILGYGLAFIGLQVYIATPVAIYHRLRIAKDGGGREIAAAFD